MTLQWTIVATFLYVEVAVIIILLLPFISPTRWQKIIKSRLVTALTAYARLYFNVILVGLVLLLLDAIREITKYKTRLNTSNDPDHGSLHYGPTMELVKEFRAQRNFYISGTSVFLWFVIKRLLALISNSARLIAENLAIKCQAESANRAAMENVTTRAARSSSDKDNNEDEKASRLKNEDALKILKAKEEEIEMLRKSAHTAKVDLEAMKRQSESLTREYDNLLKEHARVNAKLERLEYSAGNGSGDSHTSSTSGKKSN